MEDRYSKEPNHHEEKLVRAQAPCSHRIQGDVSSQGNVGQLGNEDSSPSRGFLHLPGSCAKGLGLKAIAKAQTVWASCDFRILATSSYGRLKSV